LHKKSYTDTNRRHIGFCKIRKFQCVCVTIRVSRN
jgi:hypothetical protein